MEVPVIGKLNSPLPLILALMAGGIIMVGGVTYKIVETPTAEVELKDLTVSVKRETLTVEIEASGTLEPIESVNLSPKNPGRLIKLLVKPGMSVKQGQVLAVMENTEVQAQGKQAQAHFQKAVAELEAAKITIPSEINQAQTRLIQAEAQLEETQASLAKAQQRIPKDIEQIKAQILAARSRTQLAASRVKRNEELMKAGAITHDSFDEVISEYHNAEANLLEITQRLEQIQNTANPEISQLQQDIIRSQAAVSEAKIAFEERKRTAQAETSRLEASVTAAKAELERRMIQFQDTAIRAPFDGIITQKYANIGAFVTPSTSNSILGLARGLEVVAKVPEMDLGMLEVGQPVKIVADAYPDKMFQGKVIGIAPEAIIDRNVTSFEVTIGLVTGRNELKSKMNVDVTFLGKQLSNALVVPTIAIVTHEGKIGVMVPNQDNDPEFKPVTIGIVLDEKTEILSGLNSGDRVFIDIPSDKNDKKSQSS
ncbi:efflux RND transporter periplasmic adaptor subunit [Cyanobacterium sp. uoEpiScrs1]|uniref:efflux RND transporter periplasmic adaptor subunit n=1 Tax=Cyanobacterium sp. uoEpiScrs1 TaxID=2976343 RepID=UPI0022698771|nr:efflux RND transporter periplasmic adaptor subunit [Cyanobacterium sp. uoEpiScrs1]